MQYGFNKNRKTHIDTYDYFENEYIEILYRIPSSKIKKVMSKRQRVNNKKELNVCVNEFFNDVQYDYGYGYDYGYDEYYNDWLESYDDDLIPYDDDFYYDINYSYNEEYLDYLNHH